MYRTAKASIPTIRNTTQAALACNSRELFELACASSRLAASRWSHKPLRMLKRCSRYSSDGGGSFSIYEYENEPPPSLEWLRARFTKLESRRSPNGREQWLNWVIRLPTSELIGYVQATLHPDG